MHHLLTNPYSAFAHRMCYGLPMVLTVNSDISLNSVNQLIFVMVKYGVLFEVRTEFLNNI
jgi:hypothetical protein